MRKVYEVYVYEIDSGFMAESPACCINTNIPEIKDTPIEFYAETRADVIGKVLEHFKYLGLHGHLRVAN
jgi:hypothetical protein